MRAHVRQFLVRLARDERGTSLIEMSFIIPVLVMLGTGAVDLAMCYARGLAIQQAAARTMEFAIATGFKNSMTSTLQTEAANAAGVQIGTITNPDGTTSANPKVDIWLECDGVRQPNLNDVCNGSSPARFASVTIIDTYNWMFEQIIPSWNRQPYSVRLRGYAVVRIQ